MVFGDDDDLQSSFFARMSPGVLMGVCAIFLTFIALADYYSGKEIASDLFYLVPVTLAAWYGGRDAGLLMGTMAGALWLFVHTQESVDLLPAIRIWNGAVRLAFFVFAAALIGRLQAALIREERLNRFDSLTGALNRRFFYLLAQREVLRARRYGLPLTVAYLDLDNFKQVNDRQGHDAGDEVLRRFAEVVREHVRATDLFARLGGDEFVLLFPDTPAAGGRQALEKLQKLLGEHLENSPVTVSIGALSFAADVPDVEDMIHRADELMYRIKHGGKNAIEYQVVG